LELNLIDGDQHTQNTNSSIKKIIAEQNLKIDAQEIMIDDQKNLIDKQGGKLDSQGRQIVYLMEKVEQMEKEII
jgi:hypothetical protein